MEIKYPSCPDEQADEFKNFVFHGEKKNITSEVCSFYNNKYQTNRFRRRLFDRICTVDKTMLSLITGSLTSFSVNIASNIINLGNSVSSTEKVFLFIQFYFALCFNLCNIEFTSNVIKIQESGDLFYLSHYSNDTVINYRRSVLIKDNIMFYICSKLWGDIVLLLAGCFIFAIILLFTVLKKDFCLELINRWGGLAYETKLIVGTILELILGGALRWRKNYLRKK